MKKFHKIVQYWTQDELTQGAPKHAICKLVDHSLKDILAQRNLKKYFFGEEQNTTEDEGGML